MSPRTTKQYEEIRNNKFELIKNTALKLFAKKGYHATTISAIAKDAGISKGLMYNYFDSKDELVIALFNDYIKILTGLLNPNNDHEITNEEMSDFFSLFVKSLSENNDYWKLFFQLSVQQEVISIMFSKIRNNKVFEENLKLLSSYFFERFENPEQEMMLFNSVIKGFCLVYVYTPESFTNDSLNQFIDRLKSMFIREKLKSGLSTETSHSSFKINDSLKKSFI